MIWSSLARNRSLSPLVARCLGRIATLRCAANHGWTPRRIAKNEIARFRHLMAPHLAIPNPLPVPKPIPDQLPTSSSRATIDAPKNSFAALAYPNGEVVGRQATGGNDGGA